jgi:hypothetical protein
MIKKVITEKQETTISIDVLREWLKKGTIGPICNHIIIGVWDEPFILKLVSNSIDGEKYAFFSLKDSKMTMNGFASISEFASDNLTRNCDEIYVLDDLGDLVELLKRFV